MQSNRGHTYNVSCVEYIISFYLGQQKGGNMRLLKQPFILILIGFLLSNAGCNSYQKAINRGDYEYAVEMSINKLRSKPDHKKALSAFQQAWPMAIEWNLDNIREKELSNDPFKWDGITTSYQSLDRLSAKVKRCPACLTLIDKPDSYTDQILEANEKAAAAHYEAGVRLMESPTRETARLAGEHFMIADNRIPGYRDARQKLMEALEIATLKVLVEHRPVNLRRYELSNDFVRDQIYRFLENDNRLNKYVRFYSPFELDPDSSYQFDQVITIEFVDFTIGQVSRESETKEVVSQDSVKIGESKLPNGTKVEVFDLVKAKYTLNRKFVESNGELEMRIEDGYTGRLIDSKRFGGGYVWSDTWASFNGDERALNSEQLRMARRREVFPPPEQDLFIEFSKPLFGQLTEYIRKYYRKY